MDEFAVFTVIAMTPSGDESSGRGRLTRFVSKSGVLNLKRKMCIWVQSIAGKSLNGEMTEIT